MKTSSEVNFEKRGKLTDHQTCPIHGECVCCCACNKPQRNYLAGLFWLVAFVVGAGAHLAFGAEIPYTYQASIVGGLQDINVKGDIIAEVNNDPNVGLKGLLLSRKKKQAPDTFGCLGPVAPFDDTVARRINNKGDIAGSCVNMLRPNPAARVVGFVRERLGGISFVIPPTSVDTELYGLDDRGRTVGQYADDNIGQGAFERLHGFLKRTDGTYLTIDLPIANTVTQLAGINRKGKIILNYFFVDPNNNEMSGWSAALYDNGIFSPLSVPGASFTYALDINNEDQILLDSSIGNYVQDDGIYFKVGNPPIPAGYTVNVDASGINDDGQLVGRYVATETCPHEFCNRIQVNFVATPN